MSGGISSVLNQNRDFIRRASGFFWVLSGDNFFSGVSAFAEIFS